MGQKRLLAEVRLEDRNLSADGNIDRNQGDIDASCLILGFTGSLGSGCTFLAKGVSQVLQSHGHYYMISDFLREEAAKYNIPDGVTDLQTLGDNLRRESGKPYILVEKCLDKINTEDRESHFSEEENTVIFVDGFKNAGEVKYLRQFPNFYLISVHANQEIRKKRLVGENALTKRFDTEEDFLRADKRDEDEDIPHGQQIKKCNYLADIIINNPVNFLGTRERDRNAFFNKFINDYIYPMQKVRKGEKPHDRPPSVEETLMTMAYCASKRSSCLKRNVGAVIAHIRKIKDIYPEAAQDQADRDLPFQIVSSGYNDVPAGRPCVFSEEEKCYRDSLQEEHAKKFKHCPECGKSLPDVIVCPHCGTDNETRSLQCKNSQCEGDLLADFECESCQCAIFSTYLPGEDVAPGKLLDMCRALHAEENAILGLIGVSKMGKGELVLYTTTFPCNLCANKIVAAGIKTVYYAEPYTMKESKELLEKCGVKLIKFEGIKSIAYFRLYA